MIRSRAWYDILLPVSTNAHSNGGGGEESNSLVKPVGLGQMQRSDFD